MRTSSNRRSDSGASNDIVLLRATNLFHAAMFAVCERLAAERGLTVERRVLYHGFAWIAVIRAFA